VRASLEAEAWGARQDSLPAAAVRARIEASVSRVVNLPPLPPACLVDRTKWHDKGPLVRARKRGSLEACAHLPLRAHAARVATVYGLAHPEADTALAAELAVRAAAQSCSSRASRARRCRVSSPPRPPHPPSPPSRAQAYAAYAGSAVNLERHGAAHATPTVEKSVTTALRFLGYLVHVEASPAAPTLAAVLDGDALARYVSFSLTVRCVHAPRPPLQRAEADRLLCWCLHRSARARKPSGVATDVSSLLLLMTHVSASLSDLDRAAVVMLQARRRALWRHAAAGQNPAPVTRLSRARRRRRHCPPPRRSGRAGCARS
jgi:hypothetical protein